MDRLFYTPTEVGAMLGMNPQAVRLQARAGTFPVKCIMSGNRVKIPKEAMDRLMRGDTNEG